MNNVTLAASVVAMIAGEVGNPKDFTAKRAELLANADQHKIAKRMILQDEERGLDSRDVFGAAIAATEDIAKQTILQTKLDLVNAYYVWQESLDAIENEHKESLAPYREVIAALCAITGDKIQHVTHIPGGNKKGATGERINHGNMAYVVDIKTDQRVPHPETKDDKWHSANEIFRVFAPEKLSYMYEMEVDPSTGKNVKKVDADGQFIPVLDKQGFHKTYSVNGETVQRTLKNKKFEEYPAGLRAEFI